MFARLLSLSLTCSRGSNLKSDTFYQAQMMRRVTVAVVVVVGVSSIPNREHIALLNWAGCPSSEVVQVNAAATAV